MADPLALPFADDAFDRVLTGHFYGHLSAVERDTFLKEVRRVAAELVVIDAAIRPGIDAEQWQERLLNDGSKHNVYKRFLDAEQLAGEIGGQVASVRRLVRGRASEPSLKQAKAHSSRL